MEIDAASKAAQPKPRRCWYQYSLRSLLIFVALLTVACSVAIPMLREWYGRQPFSCIVGSWRSYKLDYGDFSEWKGAMQIELVATSPHQIGLFLISADGKRSRAADSQPSIMDDSELFFGPVGSGLLFRYRHPSEDVLILDLKTSGTAIHAELRREKK